MSKTRQMCKNALVAAAYVVMCALNPVSFGTLQFRIANIFIVLPLIDKRYTAAILAGIAIANATSPLGLIDVVAGMCAEGIAYLICATICKRANVGLKMAITAASVAAVIGAELAILFQASFAVTAVGLSVTTAVAEYIGYCVLTKTYLRKVFFEKEGEHGKAKKGDRPKAV